MSALHSLDILLALRWYFHDLRCLTCRHKLKCMFVFFNPYLDEDFCKDPNSRSLSFPKEYFLLNADLKNEMIIERHS